MVMIAPRQTSTRKGVQLALLQIVRAQMETPSTQHFQSATSGVVTIPKKDIIVQLVLLFGTGTVSK
jgi:hypothetical protein